MSSNTTISADRYNTLSELCNKLPVNCGLIWQKEQVDLWQKKSFGLSVMTSLAGQGA